MKALAHKWIIYDGNCGLCLNSKKWLTRLGIIPEDKCLNYHLLEQQMASKIDAAHFRYEMALVDDRSNKTLYGLEGILYIFAARLGMNSLIKPGTGLFRVLDFLYHTISYNRYFLFPRKSQFACDCDPPFVQKYFMHWLILGSLIAVMISGAFGLLVASLFNKPALQMVWDMLLIVGIGWGLQILLARLFMTKERLRDYLRHLVLVMVIGVLILVPSLLFFWLPAAGLTAITIASVLASSVAMSLLHYRRVKYMGLNQSWTLSWFLFLQISAIGFSLYFNLFQP